MDNFFVDGLEKQMNSYNDKLAMLGCGKLSLQYDSLFDGVRLESAHEYTSNRLILPKFITRIASQAFSNSDIEYIKFNDNLIIVEYDAFSNCNKLGKIVLNQGLGTIETRAFLGTGSRAEKIIIPKTVTDISNFAFRETKFNEVVFEDGIEIEEISIESFAVSIIKRISIPKSVVRIKKCAFSRCLELTEVVINSTGVLIEKYAFEYCHNLEAIVIKGKAKIHIDAFFSMNENTIIKIERDNEVRQIKLKEFNGMEETWVEL